MQRSVFIYTYGCAMNLLHDCFEEESFPFDDSYFSEARTAKRLFLFDWPDNGSDAV
jgi:hypothetical protein